MRVRFEMSGGYGGLYAAEPLTTEVDSEALPEVERDDLVRMARAAATLGARRRVRRFRPPFRTAARFTLAAAGLCEMHNVAPRRAFARHRCPPCR